MADGFTISDAPRPELVVDSGDLPQTARELRDILANCGNVFDRDGPAIIAATEGEPPRVHRLDVHGLTVKAHRHCQPVRPKHDGDGNALYVNVTLPERVALLYLSMRGEYGVPPLDGVTTAPILAEDGSILDREGYDPGRRIWCCRVPRLDVPEHPTRDNAAAALGLVRRRFRTFPFADSPRAAEGSLSVVDTTQPAALDESAFLCGLLTAIARASLFTAPGILMTGPSISGAGTGKGLLSRAIALIAFGVLPRTFTCGPDRQELDKRIAAELVEASPMLFLDNVNGMALRSDTLASVMTERPARVRILGQTRMIELNSAAFIVITGNGLSVSEDLARRFLVCLLDAKMEDPESRRFTSDFLADIGRDRAELLSACLTIWRWGIRSGEVTAGQALGSFETWTRWVRDPLMSLGCADPVKRIAEAKANDPHRRRVAEIFAAWHEHHGDAWLKVNDLHDAVKALADPAGRGRQYLASAIDRLDGTRMAGFTLSAHKGGARWGVKRYRLSAENLPTPTDPRHRDHRGHRPGGGRDGDPMTPMHPMPRPYSAEDSASADLDEMEL